MLDDVAESSKPMIPNCQNTFPLDFSMYTFDHLNVSNILYESYSNIY